MLCVGSCVKFGTVLEMMGLENISLTVSIAVRLFALEIMGGLINIQTSGAVPFPAVVSVAPLASKGRYWHAASLL
jgi:hypothetical protein